MIVRSFCLALVVAIACSAAAEAAQSPPQHQHPPEQKETAPANPAADQHGVMSMTGPLGVSTMRDASGTSWLPDATPMFAIHRQSRGWNFMLHENLFVHVIKEGGSRGDEQFGSTNWVMGMAQRPLAGGPLTFRGMISLEPLTVGECGYPTLLATGETCDGEPLHDRQHPHDLFMELAAEYKHALTDRTAVQLYAAIAGEPALGPVAFPHRLSAMPNPIAPLSHHWLDSTHISFGVLTAGVYQPHFKVEGSVFNGREPDENRYDFDFGALDSFAGRLWILPSERWALQFSAGHLNEAEEDHDAGVRRDVERVTASVTYHRPGAEQKYWATTLAWGQNREGSERTSAVLVESSVSLDPRHTLFGRAEINQKTAHDLVLDHHDDELFTVGKVQAGVVRSLGAWSSLVPAVGASASFSVVPDGLADVYGGRTSAGFAVFLSLRPAAMTGGGHQQHQAGEHVSGR